MSPPELAALPEAEQAALLKRARDRVRRDPRSCALAVSVIGVPAMLIGLLIFLARNVPWASLRPGLDHDVDDWFAPIVLVAGIACVTVLLYLTIWLDNRLMNAAIQKELAEFRVEHPTTPASN